MLKELGVKYVIIGHSERRQYFGETDVTVQQEGPAPRWTHGLRPILCVGEYARAEREQGVTMELVR